MSIDFKSNILLQTSQTYLLGRKQGTLNSRYSRQSGRRWFGTGCKSHFRINNTSDHTDVQTNEIQPAEFVIAANDHSQVGNKDIFQAAHNRCR